MSRGTYTVYKPQRPDSKQDSWRSCTCSVIIFVVICLLILLVAWPLKHKNAENGPGHNKENIEGYSAAYRSDAEIIPVNDTDNKKTANVISQIPPSTIPSETEFTTAAFRKAHFANTTQFHNFEESTQTPTADVTTHRPIIETKIVKTTNKDFIDRNLSKSISTIETPIEREEIINKTISIFFKNVPTPETHTETGEIPTTHKFIPILVENISTSETHTKTEEMPTTHKSIPILLENVSTSETHTETEEIPTTHKFTPILLENVSSSETHTKTEEMPTAHKSIPILLENVSTSETHTETKETPTTYKIIPILLENVSTSETHTETEESPTAHKFIPILLQNVSSSETHTKAEEMPTAHKSIPILLENVSTSETHTETKETPTTYKIIPILLENVSTSETHTETEESPTAHKFIPILLQNVSSSETHTKAEEMPTAHKSIPILLENVSTSETHTETKETPTTYKIIPILLENVSTSETHTETEESPTAHKFIPILLQNVSSSETHTKAEETPTTYSLIHSVGNHNVETEMNRNEPKTLENSTLSNLLSSVKVKIYPYMSPKTFEDDKIQSTEMTKSYEAAPTTPYAAPKTTTESSLPKCSPYQDITDEEETNVCDTNTCKNIASKSLSFMKHDENICEDFYSYACGGISKDYLVERDPSADFLKRLKGAIENTENDSSKYAVALKNYFTSCMNYDYSKVKALDPAQEALRDVGFFCDKNTDFPSLTSLLTKLLKKNFPVLFDVRLDVDPETKNLSLVVLPVFPDMEYESLTRNKENEQFVIDKTEFGKGELNLTKAYMIHTNAQKEISQHILEVRQALKSFKVEKLGENWGENLLSEVLIFLELTILDAQKQSLPTVIKRRREFQYKIFTLKSLPNLQKSLDLVNWEELLTELVGPLPKDIHIQVYFMSYLSQVMNALNGTDGRDMHNSVLALYTHHLYKQFVLDQKKVGERTSYCLKMSSKQMQDVSSALYLESFKENKIIDLYKPAEDIFERLVNTLNSEINKDWLSEIKNEQLAKATIGNLTLLSVENHMPWKNPQDLIQRLEKYDVNISCFIVNTNALHERNRELLYKQLGNDPMIPENLWTILYSPFETRLSIVKSLGGIVVPLGALPYHLDNPAYPKYVAMADLGFNIAKQINMYLELSTVRILKKNDGTQPENQLLEIKPSNDETPMFVKINPSDLSTEIITDVAGAKLAYMAYKNYGSEILSNDLPVIWVNKTTGQLYFLLLAQQFCTKKSVSDDLLGLFEGAQLPPMIIINSIAINTDEFYDLNGCNGDATMNAAVRVLLPSVASTTEMDPMDFSDR